MSWLDGFDEANAINLDNRIQRTDKLPEPGLFSGAAPTLFEGAGHGLTQLALQAAEYGNDPTQMISLDIPTDEEEMARRDQIGEVRRDLGKDMQPDPRVVGVVGQALFGFGDFGARMGVGALTGVPYAGAVSVGLSKGEESYSDLRSKGVDRSTAAGAGAVQGLTASVTAAIPAARFVGAPVADYAIAVGANQALDIGSKAATSALLESGGYSAQAAQYQALDAKSSLANLIFTSAFFALGRRGGVRPTQDQLDAALVQRATDHFEDGAAPGAPVDPATASMHREQLSQALTQLDRGEPVTVIDGFKGEFLRRPETTAPVAPTRGEAMATARQDLEPKLRVELEQEAAGILPNVKDVKAELSAVARSLEGLDDTFRARAKDFQQQGQGRKQAEQSARKAIDAERLDLTDRQASLNEALGANRSAEQARADLNAMDRGEVPQRFQDRVSQRAAAIVKGFEPSKITSGVKEGVRQAHEQQLSAELNRVLEDIGHNEPEVRARSGDNGNPENPTANGGPRGEQAGKPAQAEVYAADKPGTGTASEPAGQGNSDLVSPDPAQAYEINLVRDTVSRNPDTMINSGFDADGNPTKVRAVDALAEVEAEYQTGVKESRSFMAAITCMLRG